MDYIYPNREFWENDLEVPATDLLSHFQSANTCRLWLNSLTGKQLNIIFQYHLNHQQQLFVGSFYHDGRSAEQKRNILNGGFDFLFRYYLVSYFSHAKSELAVVEVARSILDKDLMEIFLLKDKKYDKKSLLLTLFVTNFNLLQQIFHFDKVQKRSFSSFTLKNPPRQKTATFKDFVSKEKVQQILKQHDLTENDNFESQFQGFFFYQNRIYVFIRRARDLDLILNSNQVVHGYKPDWIIIDFALNANQVNLCTKSINQGLKITNSIVSQYFERECLFIDTHNHNMAMQVLTFLKACVQKSVPNVCMFELKFSSSEPKTYLTLTTNDVQEWLQKLEPSVGNVLHDITLIQHVKVVFQNKKVTLSFQANIQDPNYIAINYSEHILNKKERDDFKSLIKDTYGITVLSRAKALSK
ncbi:hypothetical protein [Candidatus Mesenet endosymbiont of Phosphuga atrata]|uniref:hypothetical protein n=1 Tax=Candidatus Mesenet endosymbiont of Phosphuga atrata TaxID=3066221 RepID=UPI0030D18F55